MSAIGRPRLKVNTAPLRGMSLFLATPMYGGNANANYMASVLALQKACYAADIGFTYCFLSNESLITRARNELVWRFLHQSQCSHLLFVDADLAFDPADILAMLHFDKEVITLPYPKKRINWEVILAAVRANHGLGRADVEILRERVEETISKRRGAFDVAISRATLAPTRWVQMGLELAPSVWVLLAREEPPSAFGAEVREDVTYSWPLTKAARRAVRYERVA